MTEHRVGELRLRVRAPARDAGTARSWAERFTRTVLERSADRLEQAFPGRVYLLRELVMRWRVGERDVADSATIEEHADDLYRVLLREEPHGLDVTEADVGRDVMVYADEVDWRAAHVLIGSRAPADSPWFFADLDRGREPVSWMLEPGQRQLAWAVTTRLAGAECLVELIRAIPRDRATDLATALCYGPDDVAVAAGVVAPEIAPDAGAADVVDRLDCVARTLGSETPRKVIELILQAHARAALGPSGGAAAVVGAVRAVFARRDRKIVEEAPAEQLVEPGPVPTPPQPERERRRAHRGDEIAVRLGGLFYLLNCVLELGIGETLWRACLAERRVIAHALAALVDSQEGVDPAVELIAGADLAEPLQAVAPDQHREVARALLESLGAALPRRGLAELPQLVVQSKGDVIVATRSGSPFVVFAWPTATSEDAVFGVKTFLECWTAAAPQPWAPGHLVDLDPSGRLVERTDPNDGRRPLLPTAGNPYAAALLAQVVGITCTLFEARAGAPCAARASDFVARHIALPATVCCESDSLKVAMPVDSVSLDLRRAGLDRDPGWVPWLEKRVRFEFGGGRRSDGR